MKLRLTAFIVVLTIVLASCSLAEDITPPPGYQSPTSVPVIATITPEMQQTSTPLSASATAEATSANTMLTATPESGSLGNGVARGNISGSVTNGSGGAIPSGLTVTLEGFDKDQSGSYQNVLELPAPVDPNGSFSFNNIEMPQERAFILITSWEGVEYQSDPVIVSSTDTNFDMPVIIYEKTEDYNVLSLNQVHLIFNLASDNLLQVTELFIVTNPSEQVVTVTSDGTSIPFLQIPQNAANLQYQLSQGSAQLLNATGGFAMIPGADKQYGFVAIYNLPYNKNLKYEQPFSLPVSSLTAFVPAGMRLRGDQLTDAGLQDIQGKSYQMYQVNNMAAGSSLSMTLSGKPGSATGSVLSQQTWILIGIGAVGILLVALGIYLYLRDRARYQKEEDGDEETDADAIGTDSDAIMDALIALDDQYKAGTIPKDAYEERRSELKERLREVL